MPGIWGYVDFTDADIDENIKAQMEKPFHKFKIDACFSENTQNATMGYIHQNIKVWSKNEKLPHLDKKNGDLFVADCVIDNRQELIAELCKGQNDIADGALLYLAIKKWGADMAKKVYGAYSYAHWKAKEKELVLGVDHTACRALYHRRVGNRVYFSTRMEAILSVSAKKLNEEWLALFLAMKPLSILTNPVDTPFVDVFRMKCASYNIFTAEKTDAVKYYDFENVKQIRYKTDAEYKNHFRKVYKQCVEQIIDGVDGKIGIMVSGGFDSSTIAAQAATKLAEDGKSLYGYTHVPVDNYKIRYSKKYHICDETNSVLKICKMYPNIIPTFLKSPEADGFSNIKEILDIYETPYKSMTNIDWINSLYKKAGQDNCKMLLTGQCGNGTVSYGRSEEFYLYEKIRSLHFIQAFSMANRACKAANFSRKLYFKHYMKELYKFYLKPNKKENYLDDVYLSDEKISELGIKKDDERLIVNAGSSKHYTLPFQKLRRKILSEEIFAHSSEYDTAFSLKNGMVLRDPARDIRIQEFCSAIPIECFVNGVPERKRLVRYYCADLIPSEFLPENAPRGIQASDWCERIIGKWDLLYPQVKELVMTGSVRKFLNWEKVVKMVEQYEKVPEDDLNGYDFRDFGMLYGVGIFLEKHGF